MNPICPHCGEENWHANSAADTGYPDYLPGSLCNACGEFVLNDEWEWPDDDAFERDRREDIARAGRMFQADES